MFGLNDLKGYRTSTDEMNGYKTSTDANGVTTVMECRSVVDEERLAKEGRCAIPKKPYGLICHPECKQFTLQDEDEFLVVACDGVFDTAETDDVVATVRNVLRDRKKTADDAAKELILRCKKLSSVMDTRDNLSASVLVFKRPLETAPKASVYKNSALHKLRQQRTLLSIPVESVTTAIMSA